MRLGCGGMSGPVREGSEEAMVALNQGGRAEG